MRPPNRESVPEIQPPTPTAEQPSPPPTFHAEPSYPVLKDAWPAAKPFALNGWFERHSFAPWLSVLLVLISEVLLLNLIGAVVMAMAVIPAAMESGGQISPEELLAAILEDAQVLLGANAVALVFGMGLVAILAARMTSRDWKSFLRIRRPDLPGLGLAAIGWAVLLPVLLWTSQLNAGLPLPQWLVDLEQEADFIGKQALQRVKAEGIKRKLVGIEIHGEPIKPNEHPWPVSRDGQHIGQVTSSVYSPRIEKNIGYAMVPMVHAQLGTALTVETPMGDLAATVVKKPFYDPKKEIPKA